MRMDKDLLVGIDVGTTGTKAILADLHGTVLAHAGQEYATAFPRSNWAEQDPDDWWRATCAVLPQIFAQSGIAPARVAALSVSCQAPSLVAVDRDGRPLLPALIWMDRRTEAECDWLRANVDEETITGINGGRIDPYFLAPKLLWLQRQHPDLYARTHAVLQANGYVVQKLCGVFSMDISHGPLSLFFNSTKQTWSHELVAAMGLDLEKLPPVVGCMDIVGHVTPAAAAATGLIAGTPVLGGMTDGTAASVEAGLVQPGDAAEMTGQSTVLLICSDQPYLGRDLIPLGHPQPGQFLVVGALVASGGALRWFRDELGEHERTLAAQTNGDAYELLSQAAATSPPGAQRLIFLPYMFGERSPIWDSDARGVFFGLSMATRKADMIRSVMEGAAYGLRHNVETAAAGGFVMTEMACVGGGARSALWNQIKADVLQLPVRLPRAATGAPMGNAIVAAVAAGLYPTLGDAVAAMVAPGPVFTPQPDHAARYQALYDIYVDLYPQLRPLYRRLAQVPNDE
jgi:xylulokinase